MIHWCNLPVPSPFHVAPPLPQEPQRFKDPRLPLAIMTGLVGMQVFFLHTTCTHLQLGILLGQPLNNELSKLNHKVDHCKLKAEEHNPALGYGMLLAHVLMFYQGMDHMSNSTVTPLTWCLIVDCLFISRNSIVYCVPIAKLILKSVLPLYCIIKITSMPYIL
ncbi:hypothetical protein EJB05_47254, partial [Eragrostis curvula]